MSEQEKRSGRGCLSVVAIAMMFGIGYVENKKCEAKWGDCSLSTMWKNTRQVVFGLNEQEQAAETARMARYIGIPRNRRVQTEVVPAPTQK